MLFPSRRPHAPYPPHNILYMDHMRRIDNMTGATQNMNFLNTAAMYFQNLKLKQGLTLSLS